MSKGFEKVLACFKEMDFHPKLSEFEDRLRMQKLVFLLQKTGVDCGFKFALNARGPYSISLSDQLFKHPAELSKLQTSCKLSSSEKQGVEAVKKLFGLKPAHLEVGTTYLYLTDEEKLSVDEVFKRLKKLKPFISDADLAVGVSKAKELTFKPTGEDLREMAKETALWDALSDEAFAKTEGS